MNINDFKIGIELEFKGAWNEAVIRAMQNNGIDSELVPYGNCHSTPSKWMATSDATVSESINYRTGNALGGEVVSPVLKYADAIREAKMVCDAMNTVDGMRVNRQCGLHISISWPNMSAKQVKNIVRRYAEYEGDIDSFMPPSRRGHSNRWCGSLTGSSWVNRLVNTRGENLSDVRFGGKYVKLNMMNLGQGRRSRLEFRHHSGTTDPVKVINWINFVCRFVMASDATSGDASPLRRTYRRNRKIAYGEIREQLAAHGFDVRVGNPMYKVKRDGVVVTEINWQQLEEMYDQDMLAQGVRLLNQRFLDWGNGLIEQHASQESEVDSGVYHNMPVELRAFYEGRREYFQNQ